jgi:DNA-directed RNA polymerase specialized sigma24 family protein
VGDFQHSTTRQRLLDLIRPDQLPAREELSQHALERLRVIARRRFRRHPGRRGPDATDDVLQKSLVRLHQALATVPPGSVAAFLGLAARPTRWVLLDILRESPARRLVIVPGWSNPSGPKGSRAPRPGRRSRGVGSGD